MMGGTPINNSSATFPFYNSIIIMFQKYHKILAVIKIKSISIDYGRLINIFSRIRLSYSVSRSLVIH